jgi:Ubiquitin-2 like Rad60 SUMO-like
MQKVFDTYAQRKGIQASSLRFLLDGEKIGPEQTPKMLELDDQDQIDCMLEQVRFMRAHVYAQWRLSSPLCTRLLLLRMRSCLLGISLFLRPCVRLYRLFVAVNTLTAFRIVPANERIDRRILLNVMGTQEVYLFWQNF